MIPTAKYKKFISELIAQHMLILGPNIARDCALHITGLTIESSGAALEVSGDPNLILKDLVDSYLTLSEPVTQLILYKLLDQYPDIKKEYNDPITEINLTCSLNERAQLLQA